MRRFDSSGTLHFMGLGAQLGSTSVPVIAVERKIQCSMAFKFSCVMGCEDEVLEWYCLPLIM